MHFEHYNGSSEDIYLIIAVINSVLSLLMHVSTVRGFAYHQITQQPQTGRKK